jgi:ABC-type uncharacterized transport system permease subunit
VWLTDREFFLGAVLAYCLSTICAILLWRTGFRKENRVCVWLLALGFVLHTVSMLQRGIAEHRCPVRNIYEATSFVAWAIVAAQFVFWFMLRLKFFGAFAAPLVFCMGVFALMPGLDTPHPAGAELNIALTSLHAALALVAYGAFGLGAVAGAMYLVQERNLKLHKHCAVTALLPPIERLDVIGAGALLVGLVLFSAALLTGAILPRPAALGDACYLRDPKVLWSVAIWALYLGLTVWRTRFARAGRKFAFASVGAFAVVLVSFWGTNLLSKLHQP